MTAYRHYWELCVLLALRDGLRSGDVWVPGSRRYADPAAYLLTPARWAGQRAEFCRLAGKPAAADAALAAVAGELHQALGELEHTLVAGDGLVRLDDAGDLVISPLTAEDIPAEAVALKTELTEMLPFAPIVSLLIELGQRTGFLDCFTHAGGKAARSSELKRNLIAVLLAHATNLGLTRMADGCGIPYDVLAWTAEWYVREETLRAANLAIIGYHRKLPLAPAFGAGTLSSSDGQRFPTRGKSVTARALSRYFAYEGLSTYTHVTDQHTTYGTKIIVATRREAHYVLDEILGNAADIPITEHATDTHGVVVTWTPLVPLALLVPGCDQLYGDRAGRMRRCLCGYGSSAARKAPTGSICSMRAVSRSRSSRGSCGSWRPGIARPTRWSPTPTTFVTCGGSSTVTA